MTFVNTDSDYALYNAHKAFEARKNSGETVLIPALPIDGTMFLAFNDCSSKAAVPVSSNWESFMAFRIPERRVALKTGS